MYFNFSKEELSWSILINKKLLWLFCIPEHPVTMSRKDTVINGSVKDCPKEVEHRDVYNGKIKYRK
jgi:hypothetical protein